MRNYLLDGLRGIAAFAVVAYHVGLISKIEVFPGGYLAVDFFFVLSGFVIDRAYRSRLENGLGPWHFMVLRLYRLYPVFAVGAVIGTVRIILKLHAHTLDLTPIEAGIATLANMLMLPVPFNYPVAFPLNNPAWSLAAEMAINLVFAMGLFRAPNAVLLLVIGLGATGMVVGASTQPFALDLGWRLDNLVFGFARASFGFTLGMVVARWIATRPNCNRSTHIIVPIVMLLLGMALPIPTEWRSTFDLAFAFVGAPLIVIIGAHAKLMPRLNPSLYWLGILSYPLYAIHFPIIQFVHGAAQQHRLPTSSTVIGIVMVTAAVAAAIVAERIVDLPARRRGGIYLRRAMTSGNNKQALPSGV